MASDDRTVTYKCDRCGSTSTNWKRCPKKECGGKMFEQNSRRSPGSR